MPLYLLLPILIAFSYVAVNLGSSSRVRVSLAKIALPLVVACIIVYFAAPLLASLFNLLMQFWAHVWFP